MDITQNHLDFANRKRPRLGIYLEENLVEGGVSRHVRSLLRGIDPEEFDVVVFCQPGGDVERAYSFARFPCSQLTMGDSDIPSAPATRNGKLHAKGIASRFLRTLAPRSARLGLGRIKTVCSLARLFRSEPVDLLHCHDGGCDEAPIAARWARIPRILGTFHVDSTYDLANDRNGFFRRTWERLSDHSLHRAIAVSEATKQDRVQRGRLPESRVMAIHNGLDPNEFRRGRDRPTARAILGLPQAIGPVVGGIGRLDYSKGFVHLIEAMAALEADFPNAVLLIAGTGSLRERLAARAAQLGIENRVCFLGYVKDVQVVLDALDVFVLSSLCEAFGFALLEAMSGGLPAIGTTVGGVPEIIVPGKTGLLVPPSDSAALATALRKLLSSPAGCEQMGREGRRRVECDFLESTCVRKTLEVYRNMLGMSPSEPRESAAKMANAAS